MKKKKELSQEEMNSLLKEMNKKEALYFLFCRKPKERLWYFDDSFALREDCEKAMQQTGEPEGIEYMIIKGIELEYEDAPAIFPYWIKED